MRKTRSCKLANRSGSITKLKGNRRKPFMIRGFDGYDKDGKTIRPILGYAATYEDAKEILREYNISPEGLNYANLTVSELFDLWHASLQQKVKRGKLGEKRYKLYKTTFDNYFKPIHKVKFCEVRIPELQRCFDNCKYGYSTKANMKIIWNGMFEYSQILEMKITKNYADYCYIGEKEASDKHFPFSEEEIEILWNNVDKPNVDLILINIYTGCRPNELLSPDEIYFDDRYFVGGSKTDAGRNRIIPIHERVANLFKKRFIDDEMNISYGRYYDLFMDAMSALKMEHTPYDCRHTLATRADNHNLNDLCIKLIMGHSVQDITKGVYTHKTPQQLVEEVNKLP